MAALGLILAGPFFEWVVERGQLDPREMMGSGENRLSLFA